MNDCRTALLTVLNQVDYTTGACGLTEMVGAVLPREIIALAREAIQISSAKDLPICAPELHAQYDDAGDKYCRHCGKPLGK